MSVESKEIDRRRFLSLGASSAVVAGTPVGAGEIVTFLFPEPTPLSVGFHEFDETRMHDADRLIADPSLFVDDLARVTIHGLFREDTQTDLRSIWLNVEFAPDGSRPFHAWYFTRDPMPSMSSSSSFVVPLRTSRGLRLTVGALHGESQRTQSSVDFGFGIERGVRCGTYAVALLHGARLAARWNRITWLGTPDVAAQKGVLFTESFGNPVPVDFPYLLVSVASTA